MKVMVDIVYRRPYGVPTVETHFIEADTVHDAYSQVAAVHVGDEILDAYATSNPNNFRKVTA